MANIYPFIVHILKCEAGISPASVYPSDRERNFRKDLDNVQLYMDGKCYDTDDVSLRRLIQWALVKAVSNHANDKGGLTIAGVTSDTWKRYVHSIGANDSNKMFVLMSPPQWIRVVKMFWDDLEADHIPSQEVAENVADYYFHSGRSGVRHIQEVLGLKADGIIGPVTKEAIRNADPRRFIYPILGYIH